MKLVYTHENTALVGLARSMLDNAGIETTVRNQYSAGGMAPPYNLNQELCVLDDADYDQAREVLENLIEEPSGQ